MNGEKPGRKNGGMYYIAPDGTRFISEKIVEKYFAPKKKMQFSQKVCVFGLILVTAAWLGNFILLLFGREPMSDVVIAIITTFGGFATGGYFALSGVKDCSKNKHGIKEDG